MSLAMFFFLVIAFIASGAACHFFIKTMQNKDLIRSLSWSMLLIIAALAAMVGIFIISYERGEGKILTPASLKEEIFNLRGEISLLGGGSIIIVQDSKLGPYAVRIPESLNPELLNSESPCIKKREVTTEKYELVSADFADSIEDYEKRSAELKNAQ